MMMKKKLAITMTALTLCIAITACSNSPSESKKEDSIPVSNSTDETESKLIAGVLEQNSVEESARTHWIQAKKESNAGSQVASQIEYKPFSSLNTMLMELNAGKVDYLRLPSSVGNYLANSDDKLIVRMRKSPLQHYHMAARADDTVLCDEINNAIDGLKTDGTLDQLATEYITNAKSTPTPNKLVKHDGGETYVVAVTGDLPPLDYVSADGIPAGFNVALLNAISEKTGSNFEIVQLDAAARLSALESGKVDLVFWIGCYSNNDFEPQTDNVSLSNSYFEESTCCVSYSEDTLDKAMSIYENKNGSSSDESAE